MNLNLLKARPGTGRISTPRGRYVSGASVSTIFSLLTVRNVQAADRWLQGLARGWAASRADWKVYERLSEMIEDLLKAAKLACRATHSRLDRFVRETFARQAHRREEEQTVLLFFEEDLELAADNFADSRDVDWFGEAVST